MAERVERLTYKIYFDAESGTSTIRGLDGQIKATMISTQKLRQEYGNFATQIKATDAEIENLRMGKDGKGGLNGVSAASGSAAAATLELGRVISDAPYGIRGMANNLSQLASNLLYASTAIDGTTKKAVGFVGAMKAMWTSIKGPLGVLLAIQAVISVIDYFAGSTSKAKDDVDELSSSLDDLITKFDLIASSALVEEGGLLELLNAKDASAGLRILINEFSEFEKKYKSLTEEERSQSETVNKLIKDYGELLNVRRDIEIVSKNLSELEEDGTEVGQIKAAKDRLFFLYKQKLELEEIFKVESGGNKKTLKEFKQGLLDLSSELEAFRNTEIQNMDVSEEERLKLEYDASRKAIENKVQEFKDKEKLRLQEKIKEINDSKAAEDEKARLISDANSKYNASVAQANEDLRSVMLQADIAYYSELGVLRRKDTEDAKKEAEDLATSLREGTLEYLDFVYAQDIQRQTNELDRIEAERAANIALTDLKIENLEKEAQKKGLTAAQIQDINNQIAKAENDRTLYQEQLDIRAAQTKLAIANQVADAIIAIAGEGSGLAKGVAIAQTIWNTKQGVMAALGSAPYGPWNIAQAAAVAAMGVKNVADIIATKAPNEKSSGVSGAGAGGGTTFQPSFNIVGASGANQLASTVAGQLGEPTRAYVVYDDLRTAGEIEANAVTAAGI